MSIADSNQEPRWRRLPEERPRQIIEAALEVFGERGLGQARLDDIAKRAGLSKGTIYLYFPNKEELFRDVVRSIMVTRLEEAEQEVGVHEGRTASDQLTAYMLKWWSFLRSPSYATLYRLIIGELHRFPDLAEFYAREVVLRSQNLVVKIVLRGIERGEFRAVDPYVATRIMSSMLISHALWCSKREVFNLVPGRSEDELLAELKDFILHALRPIPEAASAAPSAVLTHDERK